MFRFSSVLVCIAALFAGPTGVGAQALNWHSSSPPIPSLRQKPPAQLFSPPPSGLKFVRTGTAFFADMNGHLVTARHVAEGCSSIVVAKEKWRVTATLVSLSATSDLALLKTGRTFGLAATFPQFAGVAPQDVVFAANYERSVAFAQKGGLLANAIVTGRGNGEFSIMSDARPGTSGAPVLDARGLVQGVTVRRNGDGSVIAVDASALKGFLFGAGVPLTLDDRSQISGYDSRAARAASISATVWCYP